MRRVRIKSYIIFNLEVRHNKPQPYGLLAALDIHFLTLRNGSQEGLYIAWMLSPICSLRKQCTMPRARGATRRSLGFAVLSDVSWSHQRYHASAARILFANIDHSSPWSAGTVMSRRRTKWQGHAYQERVCCLTWVNYLRKSAPHEAQSISYSELFSWAAMWSLQSLLCFISMFPSFAPYSFQVIYFVNISCLQTSYKSPCVVSLVFQAGKSVGLLQPPHSVGGDHKLDRRVQIDITIRNADWLGKHLRFSPSRKRWSLTALS